MTDDLRFDELLREDAAALPPPSDSAVNPWQTAMSQILWGMGLTTITLNLLYLDYILPALGAVLLVLASEYYNEADYVRNYQDFLKMVRQKGESL